MLAQITATISAIVIALGGQGVNPCTSKTGTEGTKGFICFEKNADIAWGGDINGDFIERVDFRNKNLTLKQTMDNREVKSLKEWKAMAKRAEDKREAGKASIWQF